MQTGVLALSRFEWIGWLVWLLFVTLFLQSALASRVELESRAAAISLGMFGLLVLFAAMVWIPRLQ